MKRILTFIAVALALLTTVPAQAQVKFGLKGGVNVTNMSFSSDVLDASNRAGFFIGPTVKFTLPLVGLGVDASALYDQREGKAKVTKNNAELESDNTIKQQQIVIPINLRYGVGLGSAASIFFFAGPQFGFNVGDKKTEVVKNLVAWETESTNFSLNFGVGVMALNHLQVTANYNLALGKTSELSFKNAYNEAFHPEVKASSWQIGVAYLF